MMGYGRLLHRHRGFEIAHTHLPLLTREQVEQLQPDRMRQDGQVIRQVLRVVGRNARLCIRLATALAASSRVEDGQRHGNTLILFDTLVKGAGRRSRGLGRTARAAGGWARLGPL